MKKKKLIPIQKSVAEPGIELRHHLNGIDEKGFESRHHLNGTGEKGNEKFFAHRNDNYSFIVCEHGYASMKIDFNEVRFREKDLYFVAPGQVQDDVRANTSDYWYLEVVPPLIAKEYLTVFENAAPFQETRRMNADDFVACQTLLSLLARQLAQPAGAPYGKQLLREMLQTVLCLIAREYLQNEPADNASRPQQITRGFKQLLRENLRSEKSPARYAARLHISETYLNEVVKKTTGFTAGYWIRHAVILEAKRLLFYTEMDIKQVAYTLGFENHTYFSKLFRQSVGITPRTFRTTRK